MIKRFLEVRGSSVYSADHIHGPWYCLYETGADVQEAEEMFLAGKPFSGSDIKLADTESGRIEEPFKRSENVFVSSPVWDGEAFAFFEVDFPAEKISIYRYFPDGGREKEAETGKTEKEAPGYSGSVIKLADIPLSAAENCRNMRLIISPLTLVRGDYDRYDRVDVLWPERASFDVEPHESLDFRDGDRFYFSCWHEDSEYREEVIVRDIDGNVSEKYPGAIHFPNGDMRLIIKNIL